MTRVLDLELVDAYAQRVLATGMAPAVAMAITDRERTLAARTYGAAAPDALWPVGSIGKSFTAVLALQLAEEGVLDLHAPVTDYVPWLSAGSRPTPITLHHLLTHSAGVIASSDRAPASTYDVIALADIETGFAPGEHRHYSNVGFRAVGVVLEAVTGQRYGELLQRRVLDRLGLRDSVPVMLHETRRRLPGGHVPFYDDRPWQREHGLAPGPWVESADADGCLCCTHGGPGRATCARSGAARSCCRQPASRPMKTAFEPHEGEAYGYGLDIDDHGFGHGGDMLGYVAHMRVDAAAGLGVVAFANGLGGAWAFGEGALAIALGRQPPDPEPEIEAALADDGSCPQQWLPYRGRYRAHNPWLPTFAIAAQRQSLVLGIDWLDGSERFELTPLEHGDFRVGEPEWTPERLHFDTVLDGLAQRAVYSGTPYYRAFTG